MRKFITLAICLFAGVAASAKGELSTKTDVKSVTEVCNKVAAWQIAHHSECSHHKLDWTNGALYRGMVEWGKIAQNGDCLDFVMGIGKEYKWNMYNRTYHADDICVAQSFIELYRLYGKEAMIRPAKERAYWVASHPSQAPLRKDHYLGKDERWSWCDALFMAAPVYAALYAETGEEIFLQYLDNEFKTCTDSLYDVDEHLYYRDCMRIKLREPNGAKQFWCRGNGWVFASLPLVIDVLPASCPSKAYYQKIFVEMAAALLKIQDENGAWHSSLLDPVTYPLPENSGSAFFCYGFAWGINNGLLPSKTYSKALKNGWAQLVKGVNPDGKLGFIQPVGAAPRGAVGMDATDVYGIGAFLLAGSELVKMGK